MVRNQAELLILIIKIIKLCVISKKKLFLILLKKQILLIKIIIIELRILTNKFFKDNHIPLQVDDKVICNVNKNIYGKSHINAVIYRIIIDRNKTPRIMCFTDKNTYIYCNVEDIKKI